jgi:hypothetical protein
MSEVNREGVTTMVSKIESTITFRPDGTYARVSKRNGKIYHSDGGKFSVEGTDKLVLTIQVSNKDGVFKVPVVRTRKFSLSPDGSELRMVDARGRSAVFRRVINQ